MASAWTAHHETFPPPPQSTGAIRNLVQQSGVYHTPQRQHRLVQDVYNCCRYFHGLKPTLESYSLHPRQQQRTLLLTLTGVIPIVYRSRTYHIPVVIYCPPQYPNDAPIPYVRPTETMVIRENHANVEKSGRVLIPYYLSIWNSDDFTLYGLVSCMTRIFSHSPPVNARSSNTATANNNSSGTGPSRPPPTSTAGPNTNYNNNSNYPPSPHYPPQPSQYGGAGNQYGQPPPMFSHSTNGPGRNEAQGTGHYGGAGGHVPFNHRQNSEQRRQLVRSLTEQLTKRFAEQESKASSELISNVDEREKLNNSLQLVEQKKQKRRKLNEHHARLSDDHRKLSDWVESLGASVDVVNKDSDAGGETENNENGQQQQQVDVDLLVQYNDVVTDQMADCSAEDNALGDVLDQVDEALVKGVIDHDRYVREVRELSRKQFIPRALKKKLEIMRLRSSVSSNHHHSNSERQYAHRSADNSGPGMNAHLNARQQQQQRAAPHSVEYATA